MLAECLNRVKNGEISQRQAAAQYKIPRKTLYNKLKNKHACKPGHLETEFEKCILSLSDYEFSVDSFDLRMVIKNYLNQQGRNIPVNEDILRQFVENLSKELENVPSKNIWNFDETNLTDNPGQNEY
ncbi:hypothetical protein NQ315_012056 [Exocentrus adspersus]|uniref:HTH psq-type domain-containing protein n=1 Tax=Exocentrus adspersus TaxID=1586481 RepID=A0AAV8VJE9_9CUCU|nr:hypothetical protein NQ315_012056 [Exocentrus adspersus]